MLWWPIKGQHLMQRIMAYNTPLSVRASGIKRIVVNQAEAPFRVAGGRDRRHRSRYEASG
jgi:hypothetical protein